MSERDKWGRIPAVLVEQDQEFCALRWGELPCQAGPQSNHQVYSAQFGEVLPWTTTGTFGTSVPDDVGDSSVSSNNALALGPSESVLVQPENRPFLPILNGPRIAYLSFVYRNSATVDNLLCAILVNEVSGQVGFATINYDPTTETVISSDVEVNDVTVSSTANPDWDRLTFWINTEDFVTPGNSYSVSTSFSVISSSGGIFIGLPQISLDVLTEYRQTFEDPVVPNPAPCFNTVSSCQALDSYVASGLNDGLNLGFTDSASNVYSGNFQGGRDEGIFLEFYINQRNDAPSTHAPQTFIDIDGILTASIVYDSGVSSNSRIVFDVDGASLELELLGGTQATYRVAAYVSRSGLLTVRGVNNSVQGNAFTSTPSQITVNGVNGNVTGTLIIGDVLVYDYLAKPLNIPPTLSAARQKGDLFGDALLYLRLIRSKGVISASGITPSPSDLTDIIGIGFKNTAGLNALTLYDYGVTELLEPPLTLRYTERNKSSRLPETLRAIPSMLSASNKPAQLQVGGTNENISALGSRDELTVTFQDHPYSDFLVDPYRDQRSYNPEDQGTYWGKWLARNVYKQGQAVRYITGYELPSGAFERVHTYNYILDKVNGPTASGRVTLKAFDILQELRADKAVYPAASTGFLSADISDTATSMTLDPVGIGDEEYPAGSFRVRVGGEGFDVTRSGDVLTITQRGLYGGAESHSQDDTVQVVARFQGEQVHDIAETMIVGAVPGLQGNIPKNKWDGLAADFLPRLYSADITEPTPVEDLLAELTSTAPIYFYADVRTNLIELGVIREPSQVAVELTEGNQLIADTVDLKEYPKERIDEVWVYYRIRDAAGDVDEPENYSQRFILVNPEEQRLRGRRSIKRIYTRWIVAGARDTAEEIAQAYISRFQSQPIRVSFDLDAKAGDIWIGDVAKLISRQKQTVTGESRSDLNYQIIQAHEPEPGHAFQYIAQSYEFFSPVDVDRITITIQPEDTVDELGAVDQIDFRELYNAVVATEIDNIAFVVAGGPLPSGGAVVGAGSGQTWSLNNPDDWSWSPNIELRIEPGAVVAGRGGDGGDGGDALGVDGGEITDGQPGQPGQDGLRVRYALSINNLGIIGGGGGGGGGGPGTQDTPSQRQGGFAGSGGGGGAGRLSGSRGLPGTGNFNGRDRFPAAAGENGTTLAGGQEGGANLASGINEDGGRGGDLGQAGAPGASSPGEYDAQANPGAGGAPGNAVDGVSFVTYITRGDIRGNEV